MSYYGLGGNRRGELFLQSTSDTHPRPTRIPRPRAATSAQPATKPQPAAAKPDAVPDSRVVDVTENAERVGISACSPRRCILTFARESCTAAAR